MDARSLYDMLLADGAPKSQEKRVALDVASVKEALDDPKSNFNLHWCASSWMLADPMTKEMKEHEAREGMLQHGGYNLQLTELAKKFGKTNEPKQTK